MDGESAMPHISERKLVFHEGGSVKTLKEIILALRYLWRAVRSLWQQMVGRDGLR